MRKSCLSNPCVASTQRGLTPEGELRGKSLLPRHRSRRCSSPSCTRRAMSLSRGACVKTGKSGYRNKERYSNTDPSLDRLSLLHLA